MWYALDNTRTLRSTLDPDCGLAPTRGITRLDQDGNSFVRLDRQPCLSWAQFQHVAHLGYVGRQLELVSKSPPPLPTWITMMSRILGLLGYLVRTLNTSII